MMKRFFKAMGFIFLIFGFTACKAAVGTPTLGNKPKVLKPGEFLVKVEVTDGDFPSYRSVLPESWDETKKNTLTYSICRWDGGQPNNIGTAIPGRDNMTWTVVKSNCYIDLPDGTHNLIMVAKKGSDIALISEKTTVSVPGANVIPFILRPFRKNAAESTAASKGSVDIEFIFLDPTASGYTNIDKVTIELTPNATAGNIGTAIPLEEVTSSLTDVSGTTGLHRLRKFEYQKTDSVIPGVYDFEVKLYKGSELFATATDLVIVDPANTSSKTIKIDYALNTKPKAPGNFHVNYERPADSATDYTVEFTWQDNSYNEDHFEITICDESGTPLTPQPAMTPAVISANTTAAKTTLNLETKYKAKIKAVNKFGSSEEVDFTDSKTDNLIHLARITYSISASGKVVSNPNDEAHTIKEVSSGTAIGYYTQYAANIPVMLPGEAGLPYVFRPFDSGTPPVQDTLYTLKGWNGAGVKLVSPATEGFELEDTAYGNLTVTAVWEARLGSGINFPTYNDYCYIEGQNNYIKAAVSTPITIVAKVIPESGYTIANSKWFIDNTPPGTAGTDNPSGTPQTSTYTETFTTAGFKHVMVIIKLTNPDPSKQDKWVSAYCHVKVE